MREQDVFVLADRALEDVISRTRPDQWDMPMPAEFQRRGSNEVPTLREVVNYHAYDEAWVPDMVAGRTMAEVGERSFSGDLLGDDPVTNFSALVDRGCAAVAALADLERTVHCSFGDFSAREYLWQVNLFRGLRAHDIAKAIGAKVVLPDDLVRGLWEEIAPNAEAWRSLGVFPQAVPVPEDAPLLGRLLGLTGRQPSGPVT